MCFAVNKPKLRRSSFRQIYPISDASLTPFKKISERNSLERIKLLKFLRSGCAMMQYRDKSDDKDKRLKEARVLRSLCRISNTKLIINDDWQLCRRIVADGVHLGRNDARITQVRKSLSPKSILGVSCYNQPNLAIKALNMGADYVAFGAVFDSQTKPDTVRANLKILTRAVKVCRGGKYVVGIGGIDHNNLGTVIRAGAKYGAMISGFWTIFE